MTGLLFARNPQVLQRNLGSDVVLLLPSGDATVLEGGAAAVWRLLGGESTAAGAVAAFLFGPEFGEEELAVVGETLWTLLELGAVLSA